MQIYIFYSPQTNGKFPNQKFWIENLNILPLAEIDLTSLSKEVNSFCGSYPVVKVMQAEEKDMEKLALTAAKGKTSLYHLEP